MSCYLHASAESTSQCESCGVDLCDDCSTRFSELKCANCMKKAIMARRIRWAIGIIVAAIILSSIFTYKFNPHDTGRVLKTFFIVMMAFFAFSLVHGLDDFYKAIRDPWYQRMQQISITGLKSGIASAKGEQFIMACLLIFFCIMFYPMLYISVFLIWTGFYSLGSIFRRTIQIIKEFKINVSL